MELARYSGLLIPDSRLVKFGNHELFVVDRYDRKKTANKVIRIHQEDFCQAIGLPVDKKYQESGGPGFLQCRRLIDEYLSDQGADVRISFAYITAFNYLIGNHDTHGKNFSIIHGKRVTIAPFYDLLSTQVYPSLDNKFAMAIGQTFRLDRIKEHSFIKFAQDMNIRPKKIAKIMNEMIQSVSKIYESLLAEHEKKHGHSKIYDDLFKVIQRNLKQLTGIVDALTGKIN